MAMIDRLRLRRPSDRRTGDDGLTAAERRESAARYQRGAASKPSAEEMDTLWAVAAPDGRDRQSRPPA